jgi:hypothetical protein
MSSELQTVYLLPSNLVRLITQPVEKFRDRRLLPINASEVERMVFRKGDASLELQRNADGSEDSAPVESASRWGNCGRASFRKIQALRLEDFQAGDQPGRGEQLPASPAGESGVFRRWRAPCS